MLSQSLNAANRRLETENKGLVDIMQTYEGAKGSKAPTGVVSDTEGPTVKALRTSVTRLEAQLEDTTKEGEEVKAKFDAAREKFYKLKEELMKQRDKAAKAEARANEAEAAAGKGSYNPSTTKVLHLQRNPLHEALVAKHKNEVAQIHAEKEVLEAKLSALRSGSSRAVPSTPSAAQTPSRKAAASSVDLDKKVREALARGTRSEATKLCE